MRLLSFRLRPPLFRPRPFWLPTLSRPARPPKRRPDTLPRFRNPFAECEMICCLCDGRTTFDVLPHASRPRLYAETCPICGTRNRITVPPGYQG